MSTTAKRVPYPEAVKRWPRLRQSLLAEFDRCPLQARFSVEHGSGWSTHDQARGILAHRVFAKCLEEMARQGEPRIEVDVALAILREVLRQHDVDPRDVVAVPANQLEDLHMSVVKWASDNVWDIDNLVDVERRLTTTVSYPGLAEPVERTLSGQIDALFFEPEDRAVVIDHKDTWALPPQTEVSFGGYFQQRFYGLLVLDAYPKIGSVTLREFYVRYSEAREVTLWRADLPEVREEMAALAERFDKAWETQHHRPSPGKHCFSGNTRFLTDRGVRTLRDASGERVRVLNRHGEWEEGEVRSFGVQPLLRVEFDRGEVVEATPDHRWWTMRWDHRHGRWVPTDERVTTVEADRVPLARHLRLPDLDPDGVRHGVVYGDGTIYGRRNWSSVRLQPHKAELADWFDSAPVPIEHYPGQVVDHEPILRRLDGIVDVVLQPLAFKALPDTYDPEYARGFTAGLIATDGTVERAGGVWISCEGAEKAERIAEIARAGGCAVSSVKLASTEPTNYSAVGTLTREMMAIRLKPATAPLIRADQRARLKSNHQMRRMYRRVVGVADLDHDEVFCVVAPASESFTLANGIVTSNCSYCLAPSACPIFPEARRDGAIASADEARRVAAEAVVAKAALDGRTRALKAWADRHGSIPVADAKGRREFGYRRTTRTERPDRETMERALREAGVDRLDVNGLYRERTGTRFGEHTPAEKPSPEEANLVEQLRASLDRLGG